MVKGGATIPCVEPPRCPDCQFVGFLYIIVSVPGGAMDCAFKSYVFPQ